MSGPGEHPEIPNLPTGAARMSDGVRRASGASFTRAGGDYHSVRPGYPGWVTDFLLEGLETANGTESTATSAVTLSATTGTGGSKASPAAVDHAEAALPAEATVPAEAGTRRRALDLGAGTGLYTRDLVARGFDVTALEPSESMRAVLGQELPTVTLSAATAEDTGEATHSFDLVTVAQAWHWMDVDAASAEIRRVLRPGAVLGLIWNQLDVSVAWVHRLARIMHSGDVQRDAETAAKVGAGFGPAQVREAGWSDTVTPETLISLCHSRSYWLKSSDAIRDKVDANLSWYLYEHLRHQPGQEIQLPYLTLAVKYRSL